MIQTKIHYSLDLMNKLFSEENRVYRTLKLEGWQGPPHINRVKLDEVVSVCLFSHGCNESWFILFL